MTGIYRIRNIINNKCYYGSAKNINRRWTRHKSQLKYNRHENIILQRAWNKYGNKNFLLEIVELCNEKDLLITEQKYLNYNPEYNIGKQASGGDNMSNNPNKDEYINKIKKTINNNISSLTKEELKEKFGKFGKDNPNWKNGLSYKYCKCGKKIKPHNKTCISCRNKSGINNPFYNKHHTNNTKNKLSEQRKGKYYGNQNIKFKIDDVEYFSLGDASKKLGISITTIRWRLKSKNKKFKNYEYI